MGYRFDRPIYFECKLNKPMHIGMQLLHPAPADHSVSIRRQQVQCIPAFCFRGKGQHHSALSKCLQLHHILGGRREGGGCFLSTFHRLHGFISPLLLRVVNNSFGKQLKMKYWEMFLFLLLTLIAVSTNAQEVTCEGEQLINVDILFGHPSFVSPYKPGHILVFRCTDVNLKMHGHRVIECQPDGKWDHPYPTCREVTCEGEQLINVEILFGHPSIVSPYKPGHILVFRCTDVNQKMHGHRVIECQSDGKWDQPYPTCRVPGKCGPPPTVNDGDTTDIAKKEYNTGERIEFICFNKYKLDTRPTFSNILTCVQGEWRGKVKCLKPCTVTVEIMNERGIEFAFTDQQKLFAPHDDHFTFRCQWGKRSVGFDFRQQCNDGEMTLPECV
ncbi:complement factor H like 5 isoform X1 [Carassius gibelio]|uniref:complement factor H like 5 isoform X1 n=2 Tax=Carassius gibelio TaxID=101364 RepID=UPI002278EC9D|nr:complement factor H like 5 isoform X1 [Carassius gibelio]